MGQIIPLSPKEKKKTFIYSPFEQELVHTWSRMKETKALSVTERETDKDKKSGKPYINTTVTAL